MSLYVRYAVAMVVVDNKCAATSAAVLMHGGPLAAAATVLLLGDWTGGSCCEGAGVTDAWADGLGGRQLPRRCGRARAASVVMVGGWTSGGALVSVGGLVGGDCQCPARGQQDVRQPPRRRYFRGRRFHCGVGARWARSGCRESACEMHRPLPRWWRTLAGRVAWSGGKCRGGASCTGDGCRRGFRGRLGGWCSARGGCRGCAECTGAAATVVEGGSWAGGLNGCQLPRRCKPHVQRLPRAVLWAAGRVVAAAAGRDARAPLTRW